MSTTPPSPTVLSSGIPPTSPTTQHQVANKALNRATVKLEHQKFEEEPVIHLNKMGGLTQIDYWLARSDELPLVYRVALDVLPGPASSDSSKRVFSSRKLTCTQYRNHISASNVKVLQILKHSLRSQRNKQSSDAPETLDFMSHHREDFNGDGVILTVG